jgi:class 3 adenylate cyclase/tetratricopeptide (TPR) repeat protein
MPEERKLVTILFADVAGSTALGDTHDPEDVRALMARYYAHARRIVADFDGTLEKFIGDAVVAIFGMPQAHGDDAERALAAALALRSAVAEDAALGAQLQLRMGVNSGEVVATSDPTGGDFLVTGDAVNVAARLQQHASPGEVLTGERTHAAARFAFEFGEPRAIEAKGKPQPLRAFPVIGPRAARLRERSALVGRRPDLLQLDLLKERATEERRPYLITLVAPAGTGKTRILEEFISRLDRGSFRVATARCLPYGQQLAFFPLRGMLQDLIGETIDRAALRAAFTAGGYGEDDAAHLSDLILATLGGEGDGARDREMIFGAWRLLLETCTRQAPLVLVFEDIQWAGDTLLDLLEYLTQRCKDVPMLLIALSRPELLDRRPNWGGGRQNSALLALQPLTAAQTDELLARIWPAGTAEQRARIVERSGGNPFFALEIARGLAERGDSAGDALLPDTVHAAVLARLDLLSPLERETIQAAAVAGRVVRPPMLAAILAGQPIEAVEAVLEQLVARDLLIRPESDRYAFRHILIRDVAYGTLSRGERIRLHGALAAWLESSDADAYSELIAYHYHEAMLLSHLSAVPLELPFPPSRAVRAMLRAGEAAARAGAFAEALSHFQGALLFADPSDRLSIDEQLGDLFPWSDTAYDAYRSALEIWRASPEGDPEVTVRLARKAIACILRGYVSLEKRPAKEEILAEIDEALELCETHNLEGERRRIQIIQIYAWCQFQAVPPEEIQAQIPLLMELADAFAARGDWQAHSEALDVASLANAMVGQMSEVKALLRRRLAIPELTAIERFDARNSLVAYHFISGEYRAAIDLALETMRSLRPGDSPLYIAGSISMALVAAYYGGHWDESALFLPLLQSITELARFDATAAIGIGESYAAVLDIALAREDRPLVDAAYAALDRFLPESPAFGRRLVTLIRDGNLAELAHEMPNWPGMMILRGLMALSEFGIAVPHDLIDRAGDERFPLDLAVRVRAVTRALADGDDERLAAAIDAAEAHQLPIYAARLRGVLAERTKDTDQIDRARSALEAVRDRRFLRRLKEISEALRER